MAQEVGVSLGGGDLLLRALPESALTASLKIALQRPNRNIQAQES